MPQVKQLDDGLVLALSGGGIRAAIFHFGTLLRLARSGHLEAVSHISTVSGGSLAVALILSTNGGRWPSSKEYSELILPRVKAIVSTRNLQSAAVLLTLLKPSRLVFNRGTALAQALERVWGIRQSLRDLPTRPVWFINATNFYTGKNWRFGRQRMGDWRFGYLDAPNLPLSIALAASAGVPYVIGTTSIRLPVNGWYAQAPQQEERLPLQRPTEDKVRLWDGGVYENLGVEPLYKIGSGFVDQKAKFLLVCDAGRRLPEGRKNVHGPLFLDGIVPRLSMSIRSIDIATEQTRALRSRILVSEMEQNKLQGIYVRIGNSATFVVRAAGKSVPYHCETISAARAETLANYPTVLSRVTAPLFDALVAHGYEATDATLGSYHPNLFSYVAL